jgi:hypothetical protein
MIAAHQRLFLRPRPAFELSFCGYRILDAVELLVKEELYRPAKRRVAVEGSRLMLGDALLERSAGDPHVIASITAPEDVDVCGQVRPSASACFEAPLRGAPQHEVVVVAIDETTSS